MPEEVKLDARSQKILDDFKKISEIRQESLKVMLRVDKKISDYKIKKLSEKLNGLEDGP